MLSLLLPLWAATPVAGPRPLPRPIERSAQVPAQEPARPDRPIERLTAWPELRDEARVEKDVARLRAAETEAMGQQAGEALIADGAMVAPLLLRGLSRELKEDARERITAVLEAVVGAPHTRLLGEWFDDRSAVVRVWTRRKAARYADPGLRERAQAAWAKVQKLGERAEPEEVSVTALLLTSTGDLSQLERVIARAQERWVQESTLLREVFASLRGSQVGGLLGAGLKDAPRQRASTLLRLLAAAGTRDQLSFVAPYLEQNDNTLRVDAINACRAIVDGDPPLDRLAVFEAIEMAKKWKERL